MQESTKLYLVLGTPHSGRREIICDLIEDSKDLQSSQSTSQNIVLIHKKEAKNSIYEKLQNLSNALIIEWEFSNKELHIPNFKCSSSDIVYLVLSGEDDMIDQIESFKHWLPNHPQFSLARILSVIDCQLAYQNPEALPWFEALVYFSDYIFLTHRESLPEKWVNDFIKSFEKRHYPCVFERTKDNRVINPNKVLNPQSRRMSLLFDDLDAIDTLEIDENELPDEPFELKVKEDPYLERNSEGNRIIKLPSMPSKKLN